jgi:zinc D-Ala-D-Ala carboxypeptidase
MYGSYREAVDWPWNDFTPKEMACRGTGKLMIVPEFMQRLQLVRNTMEIPLIVTSGYRSPEYNTSVGGGYPHTTGRAVDIQISGKDAHRLIKVATNWGFTGIGVKQKGAYAGRFIHLDDLETDGDTRRPWIWSY